MKPNIKSLTGLRILVMRPAGQAVGLCQQIEALGGQALRLPTIEIGDPRDPSGLRRAIEEIGTFDLAIFVSANAVHKGLEQGLTIPSDLPVLAVGPATAHALAARDIKAALPDEGHFDSEGLLALPSLQNVEGRRVVIFRGTGSGAGGRALLGDVLQRRGAKVTRVTTYVRRAPQGDVHEKCARLCKDGIDIIVATSSAGLRNLVNIAGESNRIWLRRATPLVVSERMVAVARQCGFNRQPIVSRSAQDADIIETLTLWRHIHNGRSGNTTD